MLSKLNNTLKIIHLYYCKYFIYDLVFILIIFYYLNIETKLLYSFEYFSLYIVKLL